MADFYEDYGLEMESDGNYGADPELMPKPRTIVKKKSGWLGKGLALLLGVVIGVGGTVGGVVGAGYYVLNTPVDNAVEKVNGLTGLEIDYSKYIGKEYASNTVLQLVGVIGEVAQKFANKTGTLNDLDKISPLVGKAVDKLLETVEGYGLSLEKDALMNKSIGDLPGYLTSEVKALEIGPLLSKVGVKMTPLIMAVCYGQENVDYKVDSDGNVTMLGDSKKVTINDLFEDGPEGVVGNISLETLLIDTENGVDPEKDSLIMALAYGNSNRYDVVNGKVYMRPMVFTRVGDALYDIDGNKVENATLDKNKDIFTVTDGDDSFYAAKEQTETPLALAEAATALELYYAYETIELTEKRTYPKTMVGDLMGGNASDLFNDIELGTLFNVDPLDAEADAMTLALAYGEKGTHYEIEEIAGVKTVRWNPDPDNPGQLYGPKTVADLMGGDMSSLINDMKLSTVLNISPLDENAEDNKLMIALAYGEEGTHYTLDDTDKDGKNDTIVWLKDEEGNEYSERTIADLTDTEDPIFDQITLGTVLGVDITETSEDKAIVHAIAYGYEGTHFTLDGDKVTWKDKDETDASKGKYAPRTVGDMSDMGTIIDELRLGTVLGVDIKDENADAITHALAFGYEGTHYKLLNNGKIEWQYKDINDKSKGRYGYRTVGGMEQMGDIIDELRLGTVLGLEIDTPITDANRLTHALAFGYEGSYKYRTVADMKDMGTIIDELRLGTVLGVDIKDKDADPLTHALAFGYEETHYTIASDGSVQWAYKDSNDESKGTYGYKTVADMKNMGEILDEIRLCTVLDVTPASHRIMITLAYGSEGEGWKLDKDEDGNTFIDPLQTPRTIKDLSYGDIFKTLKLKDILGSDAISENMFLKYLGDETIDDLPNAISNLTFKKVYADQIYVTKKVTKVENEVTFYKYLDADGKEQWIRESDFYYDDEKLNYYKKDNQADGPIRFILFYKYLNAEGDECWIEETQMYYCDEEHEYYSDPSFAETSKLNLVLTSQWKYLLTEEDHKAHDYKLTEFGQLVTNMTNNVQNATLYDLQNDGLIDLGDNAANLNKPIPIGIGDDGTPITTKMGNLTIVGLINAIAG